MASAGDIVIKLLADNRQYLKAVQEATAASISAAKDINDQAKSLQGQLSGLSGPILAAVLKIAQETVKANQKANEEILRAKAAMNALAVREELSGIQQVRKEEEQAIKDRVAGLEYINKVRKQQADAEKKAADEKLKEIEKFNKAMEKALLDEEKERLRSQKALQAFNKAISDEQLRVKQAEAKAAEKAAKDAADAVAKADKERLKEADRLAKEAAKERAREAAQAAKDAQAAEKAKTRAAAASAREAARLVRDQERTKAQDAAREAAAGLAASKAAAAQAAAELKRHNDELNGYLSSIKRYAMEAARALLSQVGVQQFSDFNLALTEATSIMRGATDEQKASLESLAKTMATTTKFSATELAQAFYHLAGAGFSAADILKIMPRVAEYATAGNFDLQKATDLLGSSLSALGLRTNDASTNLANIQRVTESLTRVSIRAQGTIHDFSIALARDAGAVSRQFNIPLEETVAVLGAYHEQGLKGAIAGNTFGRMVRLLTSAYREHQKVFEEFNIKIFEDAGPRKGEFRGFDKITQDFERATQKYSAQGRGNLLDYLGLKTLQQKAETPLIGLSGRIKEFKEAQKEAGDVTKEIADRQMTAFANVMKTVKNTIEVARIELQARLAPTLLTIAETVKNLTQWWRSLDESTKSLVINLASLTAGLLVLVNVVRPIYVLTKYFTLSVAPVVALAAAVAYLATVFQNELVGAVQDFGDTLLTVWESFDVDQILEAVSNVTQFVTSTFEEVSGYLVAVVGEIIDAGKRTLGYWKEVFAEWGAAIKEFLKDHQELVDAVVGFIGNAEEFVRTFLKVLAIIGTVKVAMMLLAPVIGIVTGAVALLYRTVLNHPFLAAGAAIGWLMSRIFDLQYTLDFLVVAFTNMELSWEIVWTTMKKTFFEVMNGVVGGIALLVAGFLASLAFLGQGIYRESLKLTIAANRLVGNKFIADVLQKQLDKLETEGDTFKRVFDEMFKAIDTNKWDKKSKEAGNSLEKLKNEFKGKMNNLKDEAEKARNIFAGSIFETIIGGNFGTAAPKPPKLDKIVLPWDMEGQIQQAKENGQKIGEEFSKPIKEHAQQAQAALRSSVEALSRIMDYRDMILGFSNRGPNRTYQQAAFPNLYNAFGENGNNLGGGGGGNRFPTQLPPSRPDVASPGGYGGGSGLSVLAMVLAQRIEKQVVPTAKSDVQKGLEEFLKNTPDLEATNVGEMVRYMQLIAKQQLESPEFNAGIDKLGGIFKDAFKVGRF